MNDAQREIALFRYSLIREAADDSLTIRQRGVLVRELAARHHAGPSGRRVRVTRGTIDRWIRMYRSGGFEALAPVPRKGEPVTDKALLDLAEALKLEVPRRTGAQVAEIIRTAKGDGPSERTLQRHFARLRLNTRPDGRPPQAFSRFEAEHPGDLWTGDALHGPVIAGHKTYLFAFIDDHSRALVGYRWGLSEDTVRLEAALRSALSARGIPRRAYLDNGSAMVSRQLLRACAVLGIILVHSRPGKPEGRGKIERFFETVRMQFLVEIEANPPSSLEELNRLFSAWVETVYHRRVHSETGEAPITRLLAGAVPALPSPEQLHEAFLWSEFRTVTKVATVSLHSNVYEVDAALVASKVEVVFDPFDLTSVEIRFQGRSMGAGIPVVIGRHAHPQARPEAAPAPSPTGIDYLGLALLDRLVFGDADLSRRSGEALPVREHLADLLGVTPLLSAVDELRAAKTAVASTVADLRAEAADADATASEAESAVTAAQHEFDALVADRQGSQSRLRAAEAAAVLAASWDRFRAAASSHNAEVADVLADIGQLVSVDPVDPTASLEQARIDADAELARTRQSAQDADVAAAKAASASELLADSDGVCPTCLRPLSEAERAAALHAHGDRAAGATSGSARASEDTARVEAHVLAINEFSRRLDRLQPPIPPDGVDPGPEASVELSNARAADSLLAEQIGEARARLDTTTTAIVAARQRRQEAARLGSAARQELLLETTANAFEQIADRYLSERIEPLRRDIEHRWKLVFGSDGLVLDPTGGIRLHHGEVTLDPEDMSGGERAIAGVIVRILVAAAVTRIPTLWFDEPLEHLDPRRRASVARTLVQAAAAGTIRQVVATTYEEGIARRLAAAAPDLVGVVYADQAPIGPAAG